MPETKQIIAIAYNSQAQNSESSILQLPVSPKS